MLACDCLLVTKDCIDAAAQGMPIHFSGTVTNVCERPVFELTVTDDHAGVVLGPLASPVMPGYSVDYMGSYVPTTSPSTNTVYAAGIGVHDGENIPDIIAFGEASATCIVQELCGNGVVDEGEECDDGNDDNFDDCRNDCTLPFCGDGILDPGEDCDDGNNMNGDGCDADCMIEACGCESKVTELTLMYNGGAPAIITVVQKKNSVVAFDGPVNPGEQFSFVGLDKKGTLSTDIFIYVDGVLNTKIHTSCSQPIGPGLVSGDFEVIAGSSRLGYPLCPL
jgi:cysteine-rich repeat protein